jgi:hypothetical protein
MADDKKPQLSQEQRIVTLEAGLKNAVWQIEHMQKQGGFADSKTLSMRASRIEDRLELVELDGEMLKDVAAANSEAWHNHLFDRHGSLIDQDSSIDTTAWRKMRHRIKLWAEKRGLLTKRRDGSRQVAAASR